MTTSKTPHERFEAKVDRNGPVPAHCPELGPCHLWLAGLDRHGYGRFRLRGKTRLAHRAAFYFAHGRWPKPCALHRCDNTSCVNDSHLFEGTNADNSADKVAKGRQAQAGSNGAYTHPERIPRGERNGLAKLTARDVRSIRAVYARGGVRQSDLAQQYGVTQPAIGCIVRRETWTHVA
jgi:hypothetical protein